MDKRPPQRHSAHQIKLIRIPEPNRHSEIEKELRIITTICRNETHKNIVSVLDYGKLPQFPYYFIDTECDLSLAAYIYRSDSLSPLESIPYFIKDASPDMKSLQIWNIMRQIADGTKYIHGQCLVHRDIKPSNGIFIPVITIH